MAETASKRLERMRAEIVDRYAGSFPDEERRDQFMEAVIALQQVMNGVSRCACDKCARVWIAAFRASADSHQMMIDNPELVERLRDENESNRRH